MANIKILLSSVAILILLCSISHSAVLFEDDFDGWTTGYSLYDLAVDPPSPWQNYSLAGVTLPATCNSVARPYIGGAGISATGGYGSSKGLEFPRCSSVTNNYYGYPRLYLSSIGHYNEVFIRFYIKFDDGLDKNIDQGFKFPIDRMIVTNGSSEVEWYFSMHGSTLSTSSLSLYSGSGYFTSWVALAGHEDIYDDNEYHAVEFHIRLHPTAGRVRTWVDGVETSDYNNINTAPSDSYYVGFLNFGMGNTSDEPWNNTTWKSAWLDELVIADEYIGPISGAPAQVGGRLSIAGSLIKLAEPEPGPPSTSRWPTPSK